MWKDVKGFESLYKVSNTGKIKSLSRKSYTFVQNNGPGKNKFIREKILYGILRKNNTVMVTLVKPNSHTKNNFIQKSLSHIVAETFIPNPNKLMFVKHLDGNVYNNHVYNLMWIERCDLDMYHKNRRVVQCINDGMIYDSVKSCANAIGVHKVTMISHLKSGKPIDNKVYTYVDGR